MNDPFSMQIGAYEQLKLILTSLSLEIHLQTLLENGCESIADISVSDCKTLTTLGITSEDAIKLISMARRVCPDLPSIEDVQMARMNATQEEETGELEDVEIEGNDQSATEHIEVEETKKSGMKRARLSRGNELNTTTKRQRNSNTESPADHENILTPEERQRVEAALKNSNPEDIVTILRNHVRKSVGGLRDVAKILTTELMPNVSLLPISQSDLNFLKANLRCNNNVIPNGGVINTSPSLPQPTSMNNILKTRSTNGYEQLKHIMTSLSLEDHFENLLENGCESLADISVSDCSTLISLGMPAENAVKLISMARRLHPNLPSIEEVTCKITKDKENIATETETMDHPPALQQGEEGSEVKEKKHEQMVKRPFRPALDEHKEREQGDDEKVRSDQNDMMPSERRRIEYGLANYRPRNIVVILKDHSQMSVEGLQNVGKILAPEVMQSFAHTPPKTV